MPRVFPERRPQGRAVAVNPELISNVSWAFAQTRVLIAACELDLFSRLHELKRASAFTLAQALGAQARGVRILCDALVAMELLARKKDGYALTPTAAVFLVQQSPHNWINFSFMHDRLIKERWEHLKDVVVTGKPAVSVNQEGEGVAFFKELIHCLYPHNFAVSQAAARRLGVGKKWKGLHILDVAAGSGAWGLAFATEDRSTRVTALDWKEVLDLTREYVAHHRAQSQYRYLPGNAHELDFGREGYDLVILGHICHSEGYENTQKILKRSAQALKKNGRLLIAEFLRDDHYTGPMIPALFGVNMLVCTENGDTWSFGDFQGWLRELGFRKVEKLHVLGPSPLILAQK